MTAAGGAASGAFKVNSLTGLDSASAVEGAWRSGRRSQSLYAALGRK